MGLNVSIECQPANSPDLNVLDLGFFNAIQSLQHTRSTKNIDELVDAVKESFEQLHYSKLNNVFLTLQTVMDEIILVNGRNNYKIKHMSKAKLEREGRLPVSVTISDALKSKLEM